MIGRFLELGIVTSDPGDVWSRFRQLGFADAATGDVWNHAYGVVASDGLALGLHGAGDEALTLFFVRADVAALHRELLALGVEVERARLGSDVFNELTVREPGGMAVRVLEARTYSPLADVPADTALGVFQYLSLPCADLEQAREFWVSLGLAVADLAEPWDAVQVQGTPLAYHSRVVLKEPVLLFEGQDPWDEGAWAAARLGAGRAVPALRGRRHRLLRDADAPAMLVIGP